ncbi:MAG: hypothetical protein HQK50_19750, partial [Oligoflexia bacterium]|nr:hypothetical protein [Oligoflexia bacterium]
MHKHKKEKRLTKKQKNLGKKMLLLAVVALSSLHINVANVIAGEIGNSGQAQVAQTATANCSDIDSSVDKILEELFKAGINLSEYPLINGKTGKAAKFGISAENFLFCKDGSSREHCKNIADIVRGRTAKEQELINKKLTERLRDHGMSFTSKTGNKASFFDVKVNGIPMVLNRSSFDMLVQSTATVLRSNRVLEQAFFSQDLSGATPESIKSAVKAATGKEITDCSDKELAVMLNSMKHSIYDIKKFHAPQMAGYPFISIVGVDAMPETSDPKKLRPVYAEGNYGTPSGMSNIRYVISDWIKEDPAMAKEALPRMAKDNTYKNLRETIDSNASYWTGRSDGISVIVGPGVHNGAHPDVASISYFSGMPFVEKSDLYIDAGGNVRLNTGASQAHPVVTGIYSRAEESFLFNEKDIPEISPNYEEIEKIFDGIIEGDPEKYACLAEKSATLRKGVWYDWEYAYDEVGNKDFDKIVGVKLDEKCNPLELEGIDKLGVDPKTPGAKPGSLADAVLGKKLYTNVVGARVVDDKKVFEISSKCLAPLFLAEGEKAVLDNGESAIAGPPKSFSAQTTAGDGFLKAFQDAIESGDYEALTSFVIKEPDGSGGGGVFILANKDPEERVSVIKEKIFSRLPKSAFDQSGRVKSNLSDKELKEVNRMVVQEFVHSAAMTMPMTKEGIKD